MKVIQYGTCVDITKIVTGIFVIVDICFLFCSLYHLNLCFQRPGTGHWWKVSKLRPCKKDELENGIVLNLQYKTVERKT
jgi:hypothetical protein